MEESGGVQVIGQLEKSLVLMEQVIRKLLGKDGPICAALFISSLGWRKVRFRKEACCGQDPFSTRFPELYSIATHKEAMVSDYLCLSPSRVTLEPSFIRDFQNWESEAVDSF